VLIELIDEAATLKLGKEIAKSWPSVAMTIHLEGELGAGKTTLTRGLLIALGHTGKVKSPTYTLVEEYEIGSRIVYHFDLYRLSDPEELDYIGLDDYVGGNALCLFEWPQQGGDYLPKPDLIIKLHYKNTGRQVTLTALSNSAQPIYQHLKQLYISK
jgi:tRNA threonylcarbamoyladenosine biosynthesis protein TsaE|tara:strand:- start:479 stop:949 length:471 start_codon:yes stop_codon:yes gene_type:complete